MLIKWLNILLLGAYSLECFKLSDKSNLLDVAKRAYYSGRDIDSLGYYEECISVPDTNYALIVGDYSKVHILIGVCVPSSCKESEIRESISNILLDAGLTNTISLSSLQVTFSNKYSQEPLPFGTITAIIIFLMLLLLVIIGTYYESSDKPNTTGFIQLLIFFGLRKNLKSFMDIPSIPDNLRFLNGIRVFAANSIVFFHVYQYSFRPAVGNLLSVEEFTKDFAHLFFAGFLFMVDVFFFLSGFLMTILTLQELARKKGEFSWKMFIIKRIIRYTPVYYTVLTFYLFIMRYVGDGPQWPMQDQIFPLCKDYWWSNYLYLQDFIPYSEYLCMSWSWYVAVDLHLYMLSPLILLSYIRKKNLGYGVCILLAFIGLLYTGVISTVNEFSPSFINGYSNPKQGALIYVKPQVRITSFIIGVVLGFLYKRFKEVKSQQDALEKLNSKDEGICSDTSIAGRFEDLCLRAVKNHKIRVLGYVTSVFLVVWLCFIVHGLDTNGEDSWKQGEKSLYLAVSKGLFVVALALVFFPMLLGYSLGLRNFLSIDLFARLSKLSYGVYMCHLCVIIYEFYTRKQAVFFGYFEVLYMSFSVVVISNIVAFFIVVLVESPILSIEKALLS